MLGTAGPRSGNVQLHQPGCVQGPGLRVGEKSKGAPGRAPGGRGQRLCSPGCGVSAGTEPSSLSPSVSGRGGPGPTKAQAHTETPRAAGGQVLQGLHWIESSVLLVEGFTGRQTEDTLRTVDAKPGSPEPVTRPGSDPPLPGSSPALPTRPGLSLCPFAALDMLVRGQHRHRPTPIPTGVSELAL